MNVHLVVDPEDPGRPARPALRCRVMPPSLEEAGTPVLTVLHDQDRADITSSVIVLVIIALGGAVFVMLLASPMSRPVRPAPGA